MWRCRVLVTNHYDFIFRQEFRNHGLEDRSLVKKYGYISRMDVLQAAILNFRLKNLNSVIKKRRFNANYYFKNLNRNFYKFSTEKKYQFNTYHTFVVQVEKREKLIKYLQSKRHWYGYTLSYSYSSSASIKISKL